MKIAEIPFVEKSVDELLHLEHDRELPSRDYSGFGWAKVDRLWLSLGEGPGQEVRDALVLALHAADDGEAMRDDIELEFEIPDHPVTVLASVFLAQWLPALPRTSATVLALCNPHHAALRRPAEAVGALYYGVGDVASWREDGERIILTADVWRTL